MHLLARLRDLVGRRHVLTSASATRRFRRGYRTGEGRVLAVVRPGTLLEQFLAFEAIIAAGRIVIVQAANTGLTGGSTPDGDDYDRDVVIISTLRLDTIHLLGDGEQVVCLPGATLHALEARLARVGRQPHSVIGSSCIGASVVGGVCNNSGGALIRRGPAYTQCALFAQVTSDGRVVLVNHLGLRLGNTPQEILSRLEAGQFGPDETEHDPARACSDRSYGETVRHIDADTPARFNADTGRLFEAAGSAGRVMVLAVRLDSFPRDAQLADFYIGSNDPAELTAIRRHILGSFTDLPVQGEYLHRDAFDIAERYGKDVFLAIRRLGTKRLPAFFAAKARFDALCERLHLSTALSDRLLQTIADLAPRHLPARMYAFRDRYEHHLLLRMADGGIAEAEAYLGRIFPSASGDWFRCTGDEGAKAFLHRFAAAGAAVRYRQLHPRTVADIVALDVALPRNTRAWFETLPPAITERLLHRLYYGHFFCHVFHQDYVVRSGADPLAIEHEMWALLDARGAEYPAEHNVGHLYPAKPALAAHYRALDPCNCLNPGIGQTSREPGWR